MAERRRGGRTDAPGQRSVEKVVFGVGIGVGALADRAEDPALRRALHEELLEDLAIHGRLVFTSQAELQRFVEAVATLPTSLAKAWEAVLSSRRVVIEIAKPAMEVGLGDILDPQEIESDLADDLELVIVESDQAELLGVPDAEFSARTPGGLVEIGRITTAGRTATVRAARAMLDAPLREGDSREAAWQSRFGPLVAASSPLVVYDKFVGQQIARRHLYGTSDQDGLTWLLNRVSMTRGRRVRIFTAVTDRNEDGTRYDEEIIAMAFRRFMLLMKDRDLRLELNLVPDRVRSPQGQRVERFGHDRHLRFGTRTALALGAGVQAFAQPNFAETVSVARLPVRDAQDREERAMRAALRPPAGGWLA